MSHVTVIPPVSAQTRSEQGQPRTERVLEAGWAFRFGGDANGVTAPDFDDGDWERVTLPHSWNRVGNYRTTRASDSDTRRGIGWYRLALATPEGFPGRRQVLQFDGAGAVAEVWVNGVSVGQHRGAFSRFRFDITDHLRQGAANVIVVRTDNSKAAAGSSTEHVLPLGGDFFIYGGLYRPVSLISTDDAQIDLLDHGGPGVYISTPRVTTSSADVVVRTLLRNFGGKPRALSVTTTIRDAQGAPVAVDRTAAAVRPGQQTTVERRLVLAQPRLWEGRTAPYLYDATIELMDGRRVIDRVTQKFGVRTFSFDPNRGFILNGNPVPLHGASRHQDRAGKGWALQPADHAQDLAIMAEMGVNTIRHAHYQHAQEWAAEADKAGMVVWAELPFVHESSLSDGEPSAQLIDNAKSQLIELIRQNYNHPSIMLWSVGNEIDIRPALEALRSGHATPARSLDMLKTLDTLARQEDPGRPTAYADCCEGTVMELKGAQVLSGVTNVVGYNRYYGWYYGSPEETGPALDALHAAYPNLPVAIAEYGGGGAFSQHTDNPEGGPVYAFGRPHPEEVQSWVHERTWPQLAARPYLAGSWIWNMFDFASTAREEGDATDLNDKGLVSHDRRTRKDAFYYYQANWSPLPVLHLTGRRYVDRAYPVLDVRAYSNAERASLIVNGKAMGDAPCPGRVCVWPNVRLQAGKNQVSVVATIDGTSLTDSVEWRAPDPETGIFLDAGTLTGSTSSSGQAFGSDTFFAGGVGRDINQPGVAGRKAAQPIAIEESADAAIFGSYREGRFRYDLPLPDGRWTVSLMFMEPDAARTARRTFDVTANGRPALQDFDIAKAAGGPRTAVMRSFPVNVSGGVLRLGFEPRDGDAVVSAISVVRNRHR